MIRASLVKKINQKSQRFSLGLSIRKGVNSQGFSSAKRDKPYVGYDTQGTHCFSALPFSTIVETIQEQPEIAVVVGNLCRSSPSTPTPSLLNQNEGVAMAKQGIQKV